MGGYNAMNTVAKASKGLIDIVKSATKADSGTFKEHDGSALPW